MPRDESVRVARAYCRVRFVVAKISETNPTPNGVSYEQELLVRAAVSCVGAFRPWLTLHGQAPLHQRLNDASLRCAANDAILRGLVGFLQWLSIPKLADGLERGRKASP